MLVTHDPALSRLADRVVYLRDGRIVDQTILRAVRPARGNGSGAADHAV